MNKMNYNEKLEFLEHSKELARQLEPLTNELIIVKIGWVRNEKLAEDLPVYIMLNHNDSWFGMSENFGWNEQVLFNDVGRFVPVADDYLALNELIEKAYNGVDLVY